MDPVLGCQQGDPLPACTCASGTCPCSLLLPGEDGGGGEARRGHTPPSSSLQAGGEHVWSQQPRVLFILKVIKLGLLPLEDREPPLCPAASCVCVCVCRVPSLVSLGASEPTRCHWVRCCPRVLGASGSSPGGGSTPPVILPLDCASQPGIVTMGLTSLWEASV